MSAKFFIFFYNSFTKDEFLKVRSNIKKFKFAAVEEKNKDVYRINYSSIYIHTEHVKNVKFNHKAGNDLQGE